MSGSDSFSIVQRAASKPLLFWLGGGSLVFYIGWNFYWLIQGEIPPSILFGLTGIPAPTTGGTRAVFSLARGDWSGYLRYNPFALPISLLLAATMGAVLGMWWQTGKLELSKTWLYVWGAMLGAAWLYKLLTPWI